MTCISNQMTQDLTYTLIFQKSFENKRRFGLLRNRKIIRFIKAELGQEKVLQR